MKASTFLVVPQTPANKDLGVPISVANGFGLDIKVSVLGSSVPVSVRRNVAVTSFSIHPDGDGVVAVWIDYKPRRAFFVGIDAPERPSDGRIFFRAEADKMWVSPIPGRIGQVYDHGVISVTIDGEEYHTSSTDKSGHYVPDGDLLCRYLVDPSVTMDDVKAAVVEHEQEVSAREILAKVMEVFGVGESFDAADLPQAVNIRQGEIARLMTEHRQLQAQLAEVSALLEDRLGQGIGYSLSVAGRVGLLVDLLTRQLHESESVVADQKLYMAAREEELRQLQVKHRQYMELWNPLEIALGQRGTYTVDGAVVKELISLLGLAEEVREVYEHAVCQGLFRKARYLFRNLTQLFARRSKAGTFKRLRVVPEDQFLPQPPVDLSVHP